MDPQWVNAIILAVLVAITAYYAYEVRLTRKAGNEPAFSIRSEVSFAMDTISFSRIVLVNSGGPARDIKVDIYTGDNAKKGLFFIPALHSGHFAHLEFDIQKLQKGKRKVRVELKYKDNIGNSQRDSLDLDLDELQNEGRTLIFEK